MSLRRAVAVPFRQRGTDRMATSEFVVALSLDRDWFSPDQAKRLVDVAAGEGLLAVEEEDLVPTFDPATVEVPEDFVPAEEIVQERSVFEQVLEAVVEAGGDKQAAVAAINRRQADLAVSIEAAAVLYARREGVDVSAAAARALDEL